MTEKKRVLIVDDALDLGRLLQEALRAEHPSLAVTVVPSAEEALLEAGRTKLDLLVSDIRLPGMSGFDLVRKMRVRQPDMKIIMISGLTLDEKLIRQIEEVRVSAFLHKPMEMAEFQRQANVLLGFAPASGPASEDAAAVSRGTQEINALLTQVRAALGAWAVLVLDGAGQVTAQVGTMPNLELLDELVGPASMMAGAADRMAAALGQPEPRSVQLFRGLTFDLAVAPIGLYTLLVTLPVGRSALRLPLAVEELLAAQQQLALLLPKQALNTLTPPASGALTQPSTAVPPTQLPDTPAQQPPSKAVVEDKPEPDLAQFAAVFSSIESAPAVQDADAFWDAAVTTTNSNSDDRHIPYDQARRLGLLGENDDQ